MKSVGLALAILSCFVVTAYSSPTVHKANFWATCDEAKFLRCTKQFMADVRAPTTFSIQSLTSFMTQYSKSFMAAASFDAWCSHVSAYKTCTGGQAVWNSCLLTTNLAHALGLTGLRNLELTFKYASVFAQTGVFCDFKELINERLGCLNNLGAYKFLDPNMLQAYEKECFKEKGLDPYTPDCATVEALGICDGELVLSCGKDIANVMCEAEFAQFHTYAGVIGLYCPDLKCKFM